jgi:hypothetical protein
MADDARGMRRSIRDIIGNQRPRQSMSRSTAANTSHRIQEVTQWHSLTVNAFKINMAISIH